MDLRPVISYHFLVIISLYSVDNIKAAALASLELPSFGWQFYILIAENALNLVVYMFLESD